MDQLQLFLRLNCVSRVLVPCRGCPGRSWSGTSWGGQCCRCSAAAFCWWSFWLVWGEPRPGARPSHSRAPRCPLGCLRQRGGFHREQGKQLQGPGRAPAIHAGKPLAARDNHRHPRSEIPLCLRDGGRPAGVDYDLSESDKPAHAASGIRRWVCWGGWDFPGAGGWDGWRESGMDGGD